MTVNYGERVALVGPNGAGKSTLFSLVLGTDTADSGTVERDEWTTLGYLPQEAEALGQETVLDIATGHSGELQRLEEVLHRHEKAGTVQDPEYFEAQTKHDALRNPQFEAKVKKILRGLGFKDEDYSLAKELSGGWVMRSHLARLLAQEPDLLLLDEPTNHLDLMSLIWFRSYSQYYPGAVLLISHDRDFMDQIIQSVYEIDEAQLHSYTGNYSSYLKQKDERYERAQAAFKNQQKEIEAMQEFIDRFRSVASKASQAQSRQKQLDKLEKLEKPRPPRKAFRFNFPQPPRSGQRVLALEAIHQAYGSRKVYEGHSTWRWNAATARCSSARMAPGNRPF